MKVPVEKVQALPLLHRATVTEEYLDLMGHMNVRHYLGLFDDAGWKAFDLLGMNAEYYKANNTGGFALQHYIRYLAEVRVHETVTIHFRMIGRSARRIHMMLFMLNETTSTLAATLESLGSHADMTIRRASPYPDWLAVKIDAVLQAYQALDWEAPVSGVMSA